MFTRRQMSQLGAGGGGRPRRPRPGQVRNHLVNRLRVGLGGAAGRSEAGAVRTGAASSPRGAPGRLDLPTASEAPRGGTGPHHRRAPAGGLAAAADPRLAVGSSRHRPAFPGREDGVPLQRSPKSQPAPGPGPRFPATRGGPCPRATPGEFRHARGRGPGPDSEVAWRCSSLRFNSSGTHYATWHQPLTWLQGGELPGGAGAGSLLAPPCVAGEQLPRRSPAPRVWS